MIWVSNPDISQQDMGFVGVTTPVFNCMHFQLFKRNNCTKWLHFDIWQASDTLSQMKCLSSYSNCWGKKLDKEYCLIWLCLRICYWLRKQSSKLKVLLVYVVFNITWINEDYYIKLLLIGDSNYSNEHTYTVHTIIKYFSKQVKNLKEIMILCKSGFKFIKNH